MSNTKKIKRVIRKILKILINFFLGPNERKEDKKPKDKEVN